MAQSESKDPVFFTFFGKKEFSWKLLAISSRIVSCMLNHLALGQNTPVVSVIYLLLK